MDKIQIKCTSCEQKFAITDSYIGKMVECGACEQKFKVEGSVIIKQKSDSPAAASENSSMTYPQAPSLQPKGKQDVTFETANYQEVNPLYAQPPRPKRTLIICIGAILIISLIVIFLIGGREGGFLKNLDNSRRLILSGFIALLGSGLIVTGSRHKVKGLLLSIALGGSLMAMPFIFPEVTEAIHIETTTLDPNLNVTPEPTSDEENFEAELEKYKENIGFNKVAAAREKAKSDLGKDPNIVKALVIRNKRDKQFQDLDIILSYLTYSLGLEKIPLKYSYGREIDGEPLILVVIHTEEPLERVIEITKRFGFPQEMNDIRSSLKVIEVIVDRRLLQGQPTEYIADSNHEFYFDANYLELKNIDRDRKMDAAKRLLTATKKGRQADIAHALCDLINIHDHELSNQAIATLNAWTLPEYDTDQRVLEYAKQIAGTEKMSASVLTYLVDKDVPGSEEVFAKQWAVPKGNMLWEYHLIQAEKHGEKAVLLALPNLKQTHFKSAARILSKVGTADSLSALNTMLEKVNEDEKKYFKAAIDEIKSRQ